MATLALKGGSPLREKKWPKWPELSGKEFTLIKEVVESGAWSYNGAKETEFIKRWCDRVKSPYCLMVANGTVSLQLALEALDIGFGDEVIVPGMTWQATAAACVDVNAVPILVDIDYDNWCIDVKKIEAAISNKTKAIIPVHLYGCICDMESIMDIAKRHNLYVIEDTAHQHGGKYKGKYVGTIGDIGSYSLQNSKVLTCGEGGIITVKDKDIYIKLDALRNCGRRPEGNGMADAEVGDGQYSLEGDLIQSGNYRITELQAAVLLGQLEIFDKQIQTRDHNGAYLNDLLSKIDGIFPQTRMEGTEVQSYFNYAFRYQKEAFGGISLNTFREALSAELGTTADDCYQPLNDCTLYRPLTKRRYNISKEHFSAIDPSRFNLPVAEKIFKEEGVTFHHSILLGDPKDMEDIAAAIKKIQDNHKELL